MPLRADAGVIGKVTTEAISIAGVSIVSVLRWEDAPVYDYFRGRLPFQPPNRFNRAGSDSSCCFSMVCTELVHLELSLEVAP